MHFSKFDKLYFSQKITERQSEVDASPYSVFVIIFYATKFNNLAGFYLG